MEKQFLLEQVRHLRREGKSIRVIAVQLGAHPSRVQRALRALGRRAALLEQPSPLAKPGEGVFVGRHREMAGLKVALEDALSGQGRLVTLVGEPGIGKTRTAQELAAYAETLGAQVLWGWCYENEGAPPFWPWVQPIRSYVQQRDAVQLRSEMGPGAADITEVVSEVRGKLPSLEPPPALQPDQARFRLFDSITTFLKNAAQSQPLMLVLDDLHWADKPSLLLLQFLARQLAESRLLVVGCYRDLELSRQHPLSETLAQLSRLPVFRRGLLLGISQEGAGQFIEMTAGIRPSPQLVETIYAHTEGNPFFLKEMTRLLLEQGELRALGYLRGFER
jgi:predicted ATPase